MPDAAKQLLVKATFDQSSWNQQVASIKQTLKSVQADINASYDQKKQKAKELSDMLRKQYAQDRAAAQTSRVESDELFSRMKQRYDGEYTQIRKLYEQKKISEKEYIAQATALNKKMYENEYILVKGRYDAEKGLLNQVTNQFIKDEKLKQLELKKSMEMMRVQSASQRRGSAMQMLPGAGGAGGNNLLQGAFGGLMQGGLMGGITSI